MCLRTCANCADSDYHYHAHAQSIIPSLCSPFIHYIVGLRLSNDSVSGQERPRSDYVDVQTGMSLCCPHMPEDMFSHGEAYIITGC